MRHLNWTIKIGSDYKVFCSRQMPQFYLSKNLLHHHLDKKKRKLGHTAPWTFCLITILCFCVHLKCSSPHDWMNANAKIGFASKGSMMRWDSCNSVDWSAAPCVWLWSPSISSVLFQIIEQDCLLVNQYFRYRVFWTWRVFTVSGAEWVHKRLSSSRQCLASVWQSSRERGDRRGSRGQRARFYWGASSDQSFLFDVPSGDVVDESNQVYLVSLFFPATG